MNKSEIDAQRQKDLVRYTKEVSQCNVFEERVSFIHAIHLLLEKLYPLETQRVLEGNESFDI